MLTTTTSVPAPTANVPVVFVPSNTDDAATISEIEVRAKHAMAELESNGHKSLPLQLLMGEILADAKKTLAHGKYLPWVKTFLGRAPSWAAAHLRLFNDGAVVETALLWAETSGHRWSVSYSVERRLKIIADWKIRDQEIADEPKSSKKKSYEVIAELEQEIADLKCKIADNLEEIEELRFRAPPRCEICGGPQVWPNE
jgi:hypothetical protein